MMKTFRVLQTNTLSREEKMFCASAQNARFLLYHSDECFSAGDERVETVRSNFHPMYATYVANSDSEAELTLKLLFTGTHLRKQRYSYSPASTLNPQVAYAIAFSAGLYGLQAD